MHRGHQADFYDSLCLVFTLRTTYLRGNYDGFEGLQNVTMHEIMKFGDTVNYSLWANAPLHVTCSLAPLTEAC